VSRPLGSLPFLGWNKVTSLTIRFMGLVMLAFFRIKSSMRGITSILAVLLGFLGGGQGAFAADLQVDSIRLGAHESHTRFVLDLSREVNVRVFTLADPYRVVIDLPETDWPETDRDGPRASGTDGRGLVKGYRYGLFRPGNSRLVVDMTGPAKVARIFNLKPGNDKGHRLVVDLAPVSRTDFLTTAGWPKEALEPRVASDPVPLRQPSQEPKRSRYIVAIDAGHGGIDPGAVGRSGLREKTVSLGVAQRLKKTLMATGRYDVVMTRDSDIFHSLRDRVAIARKAKADLFISLHADTIKNRSVRGAAIYTLSENASDKEAGELASKENRSDIIAGVDTSEVSSEISIILIELSQREAKNRSAHFAELLTPQMAKKTKLLRNTHRFAGFRVLKAPDVPSVLIELGYMSNRDDEKNLRSSAWQNGMAAAIASGVDDYFKSSENGDMRQAWLQ
jgi:N-acetylmuramoyl-L-alanine amidase